VADSFIWGGQYWGPGDLAAFKAYLAKNGVSYASWAANHPAAAAILEQAPVSTKPEPPVGSVPGGPGPVIGPGAAIPPPPAGGDGGGGATGDGGGGGGTGSGGGSGGTIPSPPPLVQVRFTHDELVDLWLSAGGPAGSADIAAAIALAESQGCKYAKAGPTDDRPEQTCTYRQTSSENSYGLWQINIKAHPNYSGAELWDATTNAQAAIAISSNGSDFGAWTTFTDGAFQQYLTGSPSTGGMIAAPTPQSVIAATRPAGAAAAWSNLINGVADGVPAASTQVRGLQDSLLDIFRG